MNPLQQIPANVRAILYWVGYLVGVVGQGITIVWGAIAAASPDVEMPLGLVIASAVIGLLQTQLNLLSGSNVYQGEHRAGGEEGHARAGTSVVLGLVSLAAIALLLAPNVWVALLAFVTVVVLALAVAVMADLIDAGYSSGTFRGQRHPRMWVGRLLIGVNHRRPFVTWS